MLADFSWSRIESLKYFYFMAHGMSDISGTISESQICSIKLGEMDLIFSSHIPEVKRVI